jgi:hypothetical protein
MEEITNDKDKTKENPAPPVGDTPETVEHRADPHAQNPPTRAQWQRLYRAANAFYKLAPWKWMDDARIIRREMI